MAKASGKEQRRAIVRRVLQAMGYEELTYGDFRLWDGLIDWRETTRLLDKPPTRTALCHVLDQLGNIVKDEGRPVVVARDVVVSTEAEAAEILKRSSHVFVDWWPPDSPSNGNNEPESNNDARSEQANRKNYRSHVIDATADFFRGQKRSKTRHKRKRVVQDSKGLFDQAPESRV